MKSLYLDILPQLVPQLVLVEGRSPGRLAQVAGDALVHPDPQVLVGRLEITGFSEESPGKTPGVRPATATPISSSLQNQYGDNAHFLLVNKILLYMSI